MREPWQPGQFTAPVVKGGSLESVFDGEGDIIPVGQRFLLVSFSICIMVTHVGQILHPHLNTGAVMGKVGTKTQTVITFTAYTTGQGTAFQLSGVADGQAHIPVFGYARIGQVQGYRGSQAIAGPVEFIRSRCCCSFQ